MQAQVHYEKGKSCPPREAEAAAAIFRPVAADDDYILRMPIGNLPGGVASAKDLRLRFKADSNIATVGIGGCTKSGDYIPGPTINFKKSGTAQLSKDQSGGILFTPDAKTAAALMPLFAKCQTLLVQATLTNGKPVKPEYVGGPAKRTSSAAFPILILSAATKGTARF